ncbi:hypothetical protein GW17_00055206 [Ensete ventricosum]|nr:hypothetical protein GW17_00055206 [Ensete ventricosum]
MVSHIVGSGSHGVKVRGTVVLIRKNVLGFNDFGGTVIDNVLELLGRCISFQLISATVGDPSRWCADNENRGVVGEEAYLEQHITLLPSLAAGETAYHVTFHCEEKNGIPGAVIVKNNLSSEFLLKTLTLEDFPDKGRIHFVCNSWVYPAGKYKYDRMRLASFSLHSPCIDLLQTYLPEDTPLPLKLYREEELCNLKGDNVAGQLKEWDRVYRYDYYNDLGRPDKSQDLARPILGGTPEHPYPRRGRTGRPPTKTGNI